MNDLIRIEREVIRNIIINPEYMNALDLRDNNFSDVGCKLIFQKINKLQKENKPIDLLTIAEGFKREGFFDFIKGIMEENIMPKELNVLVEYSEVLKKNSIMRIVKSKAKVLQEIDDFDKLVKTVNEMPQDANYSSSSDEMNSYDGAMDFYKRLNQKKEYIKQVFQLLIN